MVELVKYTQDQEDANLLQMVLSRYRYEQAKQLCTIDMKGEKSITK